MNYIKYLKYTKKYLNQFGGNDLDEEIERLEDIRYALIKKKMLILKIENNLIKR